MSCTQLIAAYSSPPPPTGPESPDMTVDMGNSNMMDFKDSDMRRLSMEIERERYALNYVPSEELLKTEAKSMLLFSCVFQARVHGEEQTSSRPAEGAQIRD